MKSRKIGGIILTILLFIAAIITIVPFVWMFISSFAPNSEIVKVTGGLFPKPSTIDNYVSIQEKFNFLRLFANSLIVAVLKTGIAIYTSAVLGYVFSKMRFRAFRHRYEHHDDSLGSDHHSAIRNVHQLGSARHLHVARASWHDQRIRHLPVPPIHLGNF